MNRPQKKDRPRGSARAGRRLRIERCEERRVLSASVPSEDLSELSPLLDSDEWIAGAPTVVTSIDPLMDYTEGAGRVDLSALLQNAAFDSKGFLDLSRDSFDFGTTNALLGTSPADPPSIDSPNSWWTFENPKNSLNPLASGGVGVEKAPPLGDPLVAGAASGAKESGSQQTQAGTPAPGEPRAAAGVREAAAGAMLARQDAAGDSADNPALGKSARRPDIAADGSIDLAQLLLTSVPPRRAQAEPGFETQGDGPLADAATRAAHEAALESWARPVAFALAGPTIAAQQRGDAGVEAAASHGGADAIDADQPSSAGAGDSAGATQGAPRREADQPFEPLRAARANALDGPEAAPLAPPEQSLTAPGGAPIGDVGRRDERAGWGLLGAAATAAALAGLVASAGGDHSGDEPEARPPRRRPGRRRVRLSGIHQRPE